MSRAPTLYCDDGEERELPYRWQICSQCAGEGKSSAYLGAFTRDQLEDEGHEFIEDYFAGRYDRPCETCGGAGKVKKPDYRAMSKADRRAFYKQQEEEREVRSIERMERLMEGGWREEGWYGND